MEAVAGAGMPVGAFHNLGMAPSGTSYDAALGQPVMASWAYDAPVMVPHTLCTATTKAGGKCGTGRVEDTPLCVGHWAQVAKAFGKGMANTAGAVYVPTDIVSPKVVVPEVA